PGKLLDMGDPFEAIVGSAHVLRPEAEELCGARVLAVVRPGSAGELAACLRAASESRLPVVPVGAGTQLGFGNDLDARECVRLELSRLAPVLELDPDEGVADVAASVPLDALARAASVVGKTSALEPLRPGATVGGAIAVDAPGLDFSPDARARNDLLGIEVALANGELARAGGRVVKNVTGFDLVRLYCGSFGTLGVITRACVRLRAAPEMTVTTCARFASLEAALEALARPDAPARAALRPAPGGVELWCRFAGAEADVALQRARAPGDAVPADDWSSLRAELAAPPAPGSARVRLGARPSDVAILCRALGAALRLALPRAGLVFACAELAALPELAALAERAGATFALERAPGAGPAGCDAFGTPPPALALMRALKARFDPARVLSPGRFVAGI
ncbi:MAG TPA: FAD-binding oxidoreductase, partial [Myxococcota bacterium]|nr:FAD-binding oxidoreductase [Myxococcota bacterium]